MSRVSRRHIVAGTIAAFAALPTLRRSPIDVRAAGAVSSPGRRHNAAPSTQAIPITPVAGDGLSAYDVYIPTSVKPNQYAQYTCEFDASWVVFDTFGLDVSLEEQVASIGLDTRLEPYHQETTDGVVVYGGDITTSFSGDYTKNFLARTTGPAMRKVFEQYGLGVAPVNDRAGIEAALQQGALVWIKTTVDFLPWIPVRWITPEGVELPGVLGNDHAVVVSGYNANVAVIRDVLGPTSSNYERPYEYEVLWDTFLLSWEAQAFDGLAVSPSANPVIAPIAGANPEVAMPQGAAPGEALPAEPSGGRSLGLPEG